jgi:hypothetical protein
MMFTAGAFVGVIAFYFTVTILLPTAEITNMTTLVKSVSGWIETNLGSSLYVFMFVFILFIIEIFRFIQLFSPYRNHTLLPESHHLTEFMAIQQRAMIWANVFITIGVIATAWGMRDALLFALGNLDAEAANKLGAFGILTRLINGGVLLALTTTVVGGVGGYLMRITTAIVLNQPLMKINHRISQLSRDQLFCHLESIDHQLSQKPSAMRVSSYD